jgi:type III secretion system FlhB-like substrate exporter
MVLLSYNETVMSAPHIIIAETGSSAKKLLKIMGKKAIPVVEDDIFKVKKIKNIDLFEPISPEYYEPVAKILYNIIKQAYKLHE